MAYEFSYEAPEAKERLYEILKEQGTEAKLLAGGTVLMVDIRSGKVFPSVVVNTKKIREYHAVTFDEKEGLSLGAAIRCVDVQNNRQVQEKYPLIAHAAAHIGSPQIRNRATIVGNICAASPSADMAPVLLALDASVQAASARGERTVPLRDFFTGVKKTVLQEDEVVERVLVQPSMAGVVGGMEKLKRVKGHDLALASVALVCTGGILRVAIGACAPTPVLLKEFPADATCEEVQECAMQAIKPIDDVRASAEYRRFMVGIYIRRLMERVRIK